MYDGACGSGGMLTESQNFMIDPDGRIRSNASVYLYGKEVNGETYAICKSDMMIKGNDPANIKFGSTLATDEFAGKRFDFMLSNPPYGKSWKSDQKSIWDEKKKDISDPRFQVSLPNFKGVAEIVPAIPRSSDGQLLFLMDMVSKMKRLEDSPLGSRIASVHNGSSLFTGDAGSGESNIRRYIIENDWLEAIIQLPNNLFYNTGITTYIWVLANHKAPHRRGKVQLIDASEMYRKLRKNLGAKNCEFAPEHIEEVTKIYLEMRSHFSKYDSEGEGSKREISKVFDNRDFGYYKVTVERPLRLAAQFTAERVESLRFVPALREVMEWAYGEWGDRIYTDLETDAKYKKAIEEYIDKEELAVSPKNRKDLLSVKTWETQRDLMRSAESLMGHIGGNLYLDFNQFAIMFDEALKKLEIKLSSSEKNQVLNAISWRDEAAAKVVKKLHKLKGDKLKELLESLGTVQENLQDYGFWATGVKGEWVEYESDSELRDNENVPLNYALTSSPASSERGEQKIHAYFLQEVRPHVADAWIALDKTQIGYEISFNKYFYQHKPLRSLEDVTSEILLLEQETEGLLKRLVSFGEVG